MKFILRRRPSLSEQLREFNSQIAESLSKVEGFWARDKLVTDVQLFMGDISVLTLKGLESGLRGQVSCAPRFAGYLERDEATADDFLEVSIDQSKFDIGVFCLKVIPLLISSFGGYRAALQTNSSLLVKDFQSACLDQKEYDGRHTISVTAQPGSASGPAVTLQIKG